MKKKKKGSNPNLKREIKQYHTIKGFDSNGKTKVISIEKNALYIDKDIKVDYFNPGNDGMTSYSIYYGFDVFREQLKYHLSHEKRNSTKIILFNAWEMTKVIIPEGVEELTLLGCPKLKEIELPDSLESLTVIKCNNLASIYIPDNVHTLKLSKNKFGENFNLPIHLANLTIDLNLLGEEAMNYIDNEYVNVTLVGNDTTLGV